MRIFAIGDLHLSLSGDKPMDIFGDHWKDHHLFVEQNWKELISEEDLVLLPGDLSWAMTLEQAMEDISWLGSLPGKKIITKGNHDYWWSSLSKIREMLPSSIVPLQHTAINTGNAVITGTRGWITPMSDEYTLEKDEKIYRRELHRLSLALESASIHRDEGIPLIVMMHYPPIVSRRATGFAEILSDEGADLCIYGHIHNSPDNRDGDTDMEIDGVKYMLVSADYLDFRPLRIL